MDLTPFDGKDVLGTKVEVRKAGDYAALLKAHGEGEHAGGTVPGCPTCDEEKAAEDAESPLDAKRRTRRTRSK